MGRDETFQSIQEFSIAAASPCGSTPTFTPTRTTVPTVTPSPTSTQPSDMVYFDPDRFTQRTLADCSSAFASDTRQKQYCWVHVSVYNLILSLPSTTYLTYQLLLEVLIDGEYFAYSDYMGIYEWGNEAVARQFFGSIGIDGIQGDELYAFLDYFQSPTANTLIHDYDEVIRIKNDPSPYYEGLEQLLVSFADTVLNPSDATWYGGAVNGQPYGYGTRGLYTPVDVSDAQITYYAVLCGFALKTVVVTVGDPNNGIAPTGQMFIGTKPETDAAFGGVCSFRN